jgi:hypothetical protein
LATTQLLLAKQELYLATLQLRVMGNVMTDAAGMRAWSTETSFPDFVHATNAAITQSLADLGSSTNSAAAGAYCRLHTPPPGESLRLLPAPDPQSSVDLAKAFDTLSGAYGICASVTGATTGPTHPVIEQAIVQLHEAAADLYFASLRIQIARQ